MSYDSLTSIQTMVVLRRKAGDPRDPSSSGFGEPPYAVDDFGQPIKAAEPAYAKFTCRVNRPTGGETMEERSHDVVRDRRIAYVAPYADVREQDVVSVYADAALTDPIIEDAEVTLVKRVMDGVGVEHHREVLLEFQRDSSGITAGEAVASS